MMKRSLSRFLSISPNTQRISETRTWCSRKWASISTMSGAILGTTPSTRTASCIDSTLPRWRALRTKKLSLRTTCPRLKRYWSTKSTEQIGSFSSTGEYVVHLPQPRQLSWSTAHFSQSKAQKKCPGNRGFDYQHERLDHMATTRSPRPCWYADWSHFSSLG